MTVLPIACRRRMASWTTSSGISCCSRKMSQSASARNASSSHSMSHSPLAAGTTMMWFSPSALTSMEAVPVVCPLHTRTSEVSHVVFGEVAQIALAKGVVAHAARHAHRHAQPPQRHSLIGALAAGDGGKGGARQASLRAGESAPRGWTTSMLMEPMTASFFMMSPLPARLPATGPRGESRLIFSAAFMRRLRARMFSQRPCCVTAGPCGQ